MTEFNYEINNLEDIIDYIAESLDGDIKKSIMIVKQILNDPSSIAGPRASLEAMKLALIRSKLGLDFQYYKQKTPVSKKPFDRLTKDVLGSLYDSLLEIINTLKLRARIEDEIIDRNK